MSLRFVFEFLLDTCTLDLQQFNIINSSSSSSGTVNVVLFNDGGAGGLCDGQAVDRSRGKRLATTEKLRWLVFISAAVLVVAGVCVCVCLQCHALSLVVGGCVVPNEEIRYQRQRHDTKHAVCAMKMKMVVIYMD